MRPRAPVHVAALALLALSVAACSGSDGSDAASPRVAPPSGTSAPVSPSPSATPVIPTSTPTPAASAARPVSLPALFDQPFNGAGLRLEGVLATTDAYVQHTVSYRSGKLRITGVLNVPRGPGPFPALVLAHGHIDPAIYQNGQGMRREQDRLARAGYVVLHTDYRNHAGSSKDPGSERRFRLGYTEDVINAVLALRATPRVSVDDNRIGLVGRSMGGGVVYNVLAVSPGLVDAAVVFAPVSSLAEENFDRWIRDEPGRSNLSDHLIRRYGDPASGGTFWSGVSPRTYFDRITEPVLIHHGTSDDSCPIRWSRATARAMRAAGVDVGLRVYSGEEHAFGPQWPLSMDRTIAFLDRRLT